MHRHPAHQDGFLKNFSGALEKGPKLATLDNALLWDILYVFAKPYWDIPGLTPTSDGHG